MWRTISSLTPLYYYCSQYRVGVSTIPIGRKIVLILESDCAAADALGGRLGLAVLHAHGPISRLVWSIR